MMNYEWESLKEDNHTTKQYRPFLFKEKVLDQILAYIYI